MPRRFEGKFTGAFAGARADFERQFMSHRDYQDPANWLKMLGESMRRVRAEADRLEPKDGVLDAVLSMIGEVATMAALSDFMLDTFPKESLQNAGRQTDG